MSVKYSAWGNSQFFDANGDPAVGWKIYSYAAGSSTEQSTYTTAAGSTPQSNPIILDALGMVTAGQIWLTSGLTYKFVLTDANDVVKDTQDNISGVNDSSNTASQWQASGFEPTYISALSFTLVGDQTSEFHVGRRQQFTTTAGTVYGTIATTAYTTLTTVTMTMDGAQVLDAGLSAVNLSILRADNPALPNSALARSTAGIAGRGANSDITSLAGLTTPLSVAQGGTGRATANPPRSHLAGLTLSTAGSSATMSIAAGQATDSTNAASMTLAAAISKTTSAWAVGTAAGGLDTGAIANNTGYHFHLIQRLDTGVVDALISLSATAPTLPANYTYSRRIGWGKTNGSAQWTAFIQDGDDFQWLAPVQDVAAGNPGTSAVTRTLSVPTGVNVKANAQVNVYNVGAASLTFAYFSDLATTDTAASQFFTDTSGALSGAGGDQTAAGRISVRTNTSAQIRSRLSFSDVSVTLTVVTLGWSDRRGRDA